MTDSVGTDVLDNGLAALDTLADEIHILSAEPANYAAVATNTLGKKVFSAGSAVGSPAAGTTPTGRKVTTTNITDGSVTGTGTATNWAIIATTGSKLLAKGALASSVAVTSGGSFTLPPFVIQMPNGAL
jgi:hypothetical protein